MESLTRSKIQKNDFCHKKITRTLEALPRAIFAFLVAHHNIMPGIAPITNFNKPLTLAVPIVACFIPLISVKIRKTDHKNVPFQGVTQEATPQ